MYHLYEHHRGLPPLDLIGEKISKTMFHPRYGEAMRERFGAAFYKRKNPRFDNFPELEARDELLHWVKTNDMRALPWSNPDALSPTFAVVVNEDRAPRDFWYEMEIEGLSIAAKYGVEMALVRRDTTLLFAFSDNLAAAWLAAK